MLGFARRLDDAIETGVLHARLGDDRLDHPSNSVREIVENIHQITILLLDLTMERRRNLALAHYQRFSNKEGMGLESPKSRRCSAIA